MSALPMQSMHAQHVRNVRNAYNKRNDTDNSTVLHRSQSSAARLDQSNRPVHQQTVSTHHDFNSSTQSEPTSRRSTSPMTAAFMRPESWKVSVGLSGITWSCSGGLGKRVMELTSQGFGTSGAIKN